MNLPERIREYLGDRRFDADTVGHSDSSVLLFGDCVLKISRTDERAVNEWRMMEALAGKLPVPEVLCRESADGMEYVLMTRLKGEMSCAERYLEDVPVLAAGLAQGLKMLWDVPLSEEWPDFSLEHELAEAENRLASLDWTEKDEELRKRFPTAASLFRWLCDHKPKEDRVLSHGDYCLPNVFLQNGCVSGFLDLGHCGTADRYRDISLGLKSMKNNLSGVFGGPVREGYDPALVFDALGMTPDEDKLNYYLLLDELW